ncbi:DUF2637 domain-containing protein [Streptomyces sp. NPDC090231]|uniref:DUF2637 domain-containing protein n=1 Tax=unclassified Streptomyces TaxID=2593676 RepID=UPI00382623C5
MPRTVLTPLQRRLVYTVAGGAVLIAAIGFAGSYAAVRELAEQKRFGSFALVFPIGIDAGIVVLLCLDLLLSWLRMPFPLLRHTAWLLTAATIAFNGATAWPDPLGVGMHAVIPVLFVVVVEAARNAVGRMAEITADRHIDPVRLSRWLLSPLPTFLMWRRMKLWEMRSYRDVIRFEQDRLVYAAQLEARYGRRWRRKAPVEALLPLRLMRYGRPLDQDAPDPGAELTFDAAAAEALALAPPAALADSQTLELAAPAPALAAAHPRVEVRSRIPDPDPEPPAPEAADPDPDPDPGTDPDPDPAPDSAPDPDPEPEPDATDPADPEFEALLQKARELIKTRPLSMKGARREFHIGQPKAQRLIAALKAADAPAPEDNTP